MKLVKFVPAIAATLVLAACSNGSNVVTGAADAVSTTASAVGEAVSATTQAVNTVGDAATSAMNGMKSAKPTFETAAYFCDVQGKRNQVVSATYAFVNGKIDTATITINRKVVGQEMRLDPSYTDGTQFVEGNKVWSLESGFSQATAAKIIPIMFTDNNQILAKNCELAK